MLAAFRSPRRSTVRVVLTMTTLVLVSVLWVADVSAAFSPPMGRSSSFRKTVFNSSTTLAAAATSSTATSTATPPSPSRSIPITKSTGNKRLAAGMAALTGWADVVLNLQLGTFCTMMTGNTMWLAKACTDFHISNGMYYATVISAYLVGLALYRTWQNQDTRPTSAEGVGSSSSSSSSSSKTRFLVKIGAAVVALFALADVFLHTYPASVSLYLHKWVPASLLAAAFALVNGVGTDTAGTMTFVVTGHMTKFIHKLVDTPFTQWITVIKSNGGVHMNLAVIGGFFVGALWGNILRHLGLLYANFTYMGILLGALFLWKDSILHQVENGADSSKNRWYKHLPTFLPKIPTGPLATKLHDTERLDTQDVIELEFAMEVVPSPVTPSIDATTVMSTNSTSGNANANATDIDSDSNGLRA